MVLRTLVLAFCFFALGHSMVITEDDSPSELTPKSSDETEKYSVECIIALVKAKNASKPCKKALLEKFQKTKIPDKFPQVIVGSESLTEYEKDYICCVNEKEYQCTMDQIKDVCHGDFPIMKNESNELARTLLHLDCSQRPLRCENTDLDSGASLEKTSEPETSLLVSMMKELEQKSEQGFLRLSAEIKAVNENVAKDFKEVSDKLDRIFLKLRNQRRTKEYKETDP